MKKRLLSKLLYGKTLGIDQAQIVRACQSYHLNDAVVDGKIDVDHPASKSYVALMFKKKNKDYTVDPFENFPEREEGGTSDFLNVGEKVSIETKEPGGRTKGKENKKASSDSEGSTVNSVPDYLEAYADMPLRKLIMKFGTDVRFVDWLSALQKLESINEKRLKNEEKRDTLISRDLVEQYIVSEFNECHAKIMTDGAKAIVNLVISKYESNIAPEVIERNVSDTVSTYINKAKKKIKKTLKKRRKV